MLLGIPTLCRYDLLDELLRSAEAGDVRPSGYFIIDNGGGYTRERLHAALGTRAVVAELLSPGRNLGVAPSWNRMLDRALGDGEPIIISNDDIRFGPRTFAELSKALENGAAFVEGDGWALFGQRPEVLGRVGYYDENFWPAYYEDVDYDLRLRRAGIEPAHPLSELPAHVGWATSKALADSRWLDEGRARNHQYFLRKWGGESRNPRWNGHPGIMQYEEPFDGKAPPGWKLRGGQMPKQEVACMRWDVLNHIAQRTAALRYLEIGVADGTTMRQIEVPERWGVDPVPNLAAVRECSVFVPQKSEKFFDSVAPHAGKFDLVFIDGDHLAPLVYEEVHRALAVLHPRGVIVLHDCNPHTEAMQQVPGAPGEWTGDVWKTIVRLRREGHYIRVIDSDYGIGVLIPNCFGDPSPPRTPPVGLDDLTWENLVQHRREWLGLLDSWEWKDWFEQALNGGANV